MPPIVVAKSSCRLCPDKVARSVQTSGRDPKEARGSDATCLFFLRIHLRGNDVARDLAVEVMQATLHEQPRPSRGPLRS
jgi:hypothetical protein